jgi:hypothetical protein
MFGLICRQRKCMGDFPLYHNASVIFLFYLICPLCFHIIHKLDSKTASEVPKEIRDKLSQIGTYVLYVMIMMMMMMRIFI